MTMEVNGAAVLAAIAKSPAAFSLNEAQINALAMATLIARFKDKSVGLDSIRSIARTIGTDDFRLSLDHLAAKDVAALTKRLDPKHPDLRTASEAWHREQVWKLASGRIEPALATPRAPTKKAAAATDPEAKTGAVMKSKALKPKPEAKVAKSRAPRKKA